MKLLYVMTISGKAITSFMRSAIYAANELGIDFTMAFNMSMADEAEWEKAKKQYGIKTKHIDFDRNPLGKQNIKAKSQLQDLIEQEKYDIVHCNTPTAGVVTRLCARDMKNPPFIIYMAHGFHFWKGAPVKNWLFYYPVERYLAHFTDLLITINEEDFEAAQNFKLRGKAYYIPGVGVDVNAISNLQVDRASKRQELGIATEDFVVISVGELNSNKNQKIIIQALANIDLEKIHYIICGKGSYESKLKEQVAALHLESKVHFVGFRDDVKELLKISDVFVFSSFREGLPVAIMEAMAAGLPCIVSNIRGNVDLIDEEKGGYLCDPQSSDDFAKAMKKLESNRQSGIKMGQYNMEKIKLFDVSNVTALMEKIYSEQVNR